MNAITETEFETITTGIYEDRESIIEHNPIGTREEVLLWMLMNCLVSYLSISDLETPCFTGRPDAATYADAIRFIMQKRKSEPFDIEPYINRLMSA